MKTIQNVIDRIETLAPCGLQEGWDNCGVQVGYDLDAKCTGVVLAVDMCMEAMEMAEKCGANLIVTHHPLTITGVKNFTKNTSLGLIIQKAIQKQITIYSAHTSLDSCSGGLSDYICQKIELKNTKPIIKNITDQTVGLGRIGELEKSMEVAEFAELLKNKLTLSSVRYTNSNRKIKRIAVCSGSGASLLEELNEQKVEAYICSDLKYHAFLDMNEKGITLFEIDHFESEFCATEILNSLLLDFFINFTPQTLNLRPTKYI